MYITFFSYNYVYQCKVDTLNIFIFLINYYNMLIVSFANLFTHFATYLYFRK